jgi:hypothetical protein
LKLLSESRTKIIIDSLNHYHNRLLKLSEEEEIPHIIRNDIITEYSNAKHMKDEIHANGLTHTVNDEGLRFLDIPKNRKTIISAVKCYVSDLELAASDVDKKLGNITLASDSIKEEVELLKNAIVDFSK